MSVLSAQEIQISRGAAFSQAFTCSLADIVGPGYPPTDIQTFATGGGTFSVSVARRDDLAFGEACTGTATIAGNVLTLAITAAETGAMRDRRGYFTVDVSNGIERWRVIDGTWLLLIPSLGPA